MVAEAYPEYRGQFTCFGFDWLGRQFATEANRGDAHDPDVVIIQPGAGDILETPFAFSVFHDDAMVDYVEDVLALSFFDEWRDGHREVLQFDQCVGYSKPLFLGGQDEVSNLEVADIEVYWTIMGQLRLALMGLPEGTKVSDVRIEEIQ
jgi:hypothetical protein